MTDEVTQEIDNTILDQLKDDSLIYRTEANLGPNLIKAGIVSNNIEEFRNRAFSILDTESDVIGVIKPSSLLRDRRITSMLNEVNIEYSHSATSHDRFQTITLPEHLQQQKKEDCIRKRLVLLIHDDLQFNSSRLVVKECLKHVKNNNQKLKILTGDLSDLNMEILVLNESVELE